MGYAKDLPKDYLNDILVRIAHHSAGIEGNTISLPATVSILLHGTLPASGTTVREFYEIDNHKLAFTHLLEHLANGDALSVGLIEELHADLTDRLQHDKVQFKKSEDRIKGAALQTASPAQTSLLLQKLVDNLAYRLASAVTDEEKLEVILSTHIQFERLHPFSDGNGRTGRLVMNYSLLQEGLPPLILEKEAKEIYFKILAEQDITAFMALSRKILVREKERIRAFQNMSREQITYD